MIWTVLKYRKWLIAGLMLALIGGLYVRGEIIAAQRDKEHARRVIAEDSLKASERLRIAETAALERAREQDHDRHLFISENQAAIAAGRIEGDGALAPVLRDTLERVRSRAASRASAHSR